MKKDRDANSKGTMVLIETYWNVNSNLGGMAVDVNKVLIETYWNVNLYLKTNFTPSL